jgi:hypothetical protein
MRPLRVFVNIWQIARTRLMLNRCALFAFGMIRMCIELYAWFVGEVYGLTGENIAEEGTQDELGELLWFWLEVSQHAATDTFVYEGLAECDVSFEDWAQAKGEKSIEFSPAASRALYERASQKIVLGQTLQMCDLPTILPPRHLAVEARQFLSGLLWLHGTELAL